jgi:predicted dehydrogenase
MKHLNRRDFLRGSAALVSAAALDLALVQAQSGQPQSTARGPANEQIHVSVIGVNSRGRDHVRGFAGRNNCLVTHICDADSAVVGPAMTLAEGAQRRRPTFVQDLRRIMDDASIHVVSIATPNHWHALAAIWALQAGKDVYVEKPVSHNVSEGRRIVEAARRHNHICQTGTQIRSATGIRQAIAFLRSGGLGQVRVARGLCYKPRGSIGRTTGAGSIPRTVDYDLWCGPAPNQPPHRRRFHYDWHWFWDYGNGDLGNQGIHQMDVARWGLGKNELARSVLSLGGRFGYVDDGETANTQVAVFDYGDSQLIFEVRGLTTPNYRGAMVGNVFHCANGYLVCPGYTSAVAYDNDGQVIRRFQGPEDHFANFVQAVRSRRTQDLNADIEQGHLSSALCHLANVSYRLGQPQRFNERTRAFGDDREAYDTLARTQDHLRENRVPLDKTTYRLGRRLTVDPRTERFVRDEEANRQLTRQYRRGFEVPARI